MSKKSDSGARQTSSGAQNIQGNKWKKGISETKTEADKLEAKG
jgi:hypothetical protein